MTGTIFLEVPNELTRGMLEQRIRLPLLTAIADVADGEIVTFAIVVNPTITTDEIEIIESSAPAAPAQPQAAGMPEPIPPPGQQVRLLPEKISQKSVTSVDTLCR